MKPDQASGIRFIGLKMQTLQVVVKNVTLGQDQVAKDKLVKSGHRGRREWNISFLKGSSIKTI